MAKKVEWLDINAAKFRKLLNGTGDSIATIAERIGCGNKLHNALNRSRIMKTDAIALEAVYGICYEDYASSVGITGEPRSKEQEDLKVICETLGRIEALLRSYKEAEESL
jgi:hypothetical protein